MANANDLHNLSLPDLMKLLTDQASTLAQKEIELAKAELLVKKEQATPGLKTLVVAAVFGVIGLSALTTLLIVGMSALLPTWAAALLITVIASLVAIALALNGKSTLESLSPMPEETILTLKEDLRWAKRQRISTAR
ncbi:MAG: phage holin family protein [Egibacteraceae bacterium]